MNLLRPWLLSCLLILSAPAFAAIEILEFKDDEKQQDYKVLTQELRCLVCQNQNLADSNAELAVDLKNEIYKMVESGSSRQQIVDFMVDRYGDFVLYRPPFQTNTLILWGGPFLFLLGGMILAYFMVKRQLLRKDDDSGAENDTEETL